MIKKILMSLREYKRPSLLAPLFVVGEVIMEVSIPYVMSRLIDNGINKGQISEVLRLGIILLVCALVSLVFGILAGRQAAVASCGLAQNLRKDMYYNVQNFSFSNIDKFSTASIVTRLTTDITNVQNAYQMVVRTAVRSPIMLIAALAVSFQFNARLSLVFVIIIPFLFVVLFAIIFNVHPIFERVFRTYDKLNGVVQENLRGIRVVKSFIREEHENEKFGKISELIFKDFSNAEKIIALNMPAMMISIYACILTISWFGAKIIVNSGGIAGAGGLTTGDLMALFTYAMQILMSLLLISMVFVMVIIARPSGERIVEILDEKSDIRNKENPVMSVPDGTIRFENVQFSYTGSMEKRVLSDIDLEIKSGQLIGIVGGTGSSKSSLVQLIPRLYDVTQGRVTVGGTDVRDYDIETLRNSVAMVLQKNELFSGTVRENLKWGNENATDEEIEAACRLAQADEFIQKFPNKYDTYIEQGGSNVSGGQKQRICIARALLKNPKILILDDSTSAVDTKTDALIRKAFREKIPETTKIIIAQRIASVEEADKIIILDGGKIVAMGTHDELLKCSSIYREVYNSQMKGGIQHGKE